MIRGIYQRHIGDNIYSKKVECIICKRIISSSQRAMISHARSHVRRGEAKEVYRQVSYLVTEFERV